MAEEIVIDIDERGNVKLDVTGVVGPDCQKLTAAIEAALGTTTSVVEKPEFRQARTASRPRTATR